MSSQKPMYLIAGGRGRKIFSSFRIFKDIVRDTGKKKPVIAYIGVASLGDNPLVFQIVSALLRLNCSCQISRVLIAPDNADLNKARKVLESADIIFFSGGDVEAGMKILEEKNMAGYFRGLSSKGKLFAGVSAGSILLADEWVKWTNPDDDSICTLFSCLGAAPVICDTHAEKDNWSELKAALIFKETGTIGYGITSGSCLKVHPDGRLEAVNGPVARFIQQNGKIEQLPDLLPGTARINTVNST
jgi:cyanophycinase-like exopeptidase